MKIDNFLTRIKINKQYAASTVKSYSMILKKFDSVIKELTFGKRGVEESEQLTVNDVEYFIWREKIKGKSAKTCNWYLAVIRDFIQFCDRNHEKVFDYRDIILMKQPKTKVDALSENEVQRLLNYMKADRSKDELTKSRDYAMVSILVNTGLRVSELCNIKTSDIREELQIIWKNQTLRLVYLFQEHLALIKLYLFLRESKNIKSEYLFCSHSNNSKWKQLSRCAVEVIVKDAAKNAWIKNSVRPHKLRHTFATCLLRRWGNIYYIKELLWHQYITTTQTYLSATNNDLKKTQNLLKSARLAEQEMEELTPMPWQIIIKDSRLFDQFTTRNVYPNLNGVGRRVPNYEFSGY